VRERRERDIDFQRHWKESCMLSSGVREEEAQQDWVSRRRKRGEEEVDII
jgi:hypothetical protein